MATKLTAGKGHLSLSDYGTEVRVTAFLETLEQVTERKTNPPTTTLKTPHSPIPPSLPRVTPEDPTLDQATEHTLDIPNRCFLCAPVHAGTAGDGFC